MKHLVKHKVIRKRASLSLLTQINHLSIRDNGRFSPVVFKIASENDIDLSQVPGTGFEGRVTKKILKLIFKKITNKIQKKHIPLR